MSIAIDPGGAIPSNVLDTVLGLPSSVRERLAEILFDSVDQDANESAALREEWRAEFEKRINDIENGKVPLVDGRATLARLRKEVIERHGL